MSKRFKKRLKRIPLKVLLKPLTPAEPPPTDEGPIKQPLIHESQEPVKPPQGGKARAKKIGKSKRMAIARKIDRSRWNTKKKRSY